jgi:hypothetical protein
LHVRIARFEFGLGWGQAVATQDFEVALAIALKRLFQGAARQPTPHAPPQLAERDDRRREGDDRQNRVDSPLRHHAASGEALAPGSP